jgi:hypothetical protein
VVVHGDPGALGGEGAHACGADPALPAGHEHALSPQSALHT